MHDRGHCVCELIQRDRRQVKRTRRFVFPEHVDGEHCLLLTRFRKSRQTCSAQFLGSELGRTRTGCQRRAL